MTGASQEEDTFVETEAYGRTDWDPPGIDKISGKINSQGSNNMQNVSIEWDKKVVSHRHCVGNYDVPGLHK